MFSTLWQLLKLIRYLLPFLQDVADVSKTDTDSDKLKARAIKRFLTVIAWRIVFIALFFVSIFKYAIPLYSQNAVLLQEISERKDEIIDLKIKYQKAIDSQYIAMSNTQTCNAKLEIAYTEIKRLQDAIKDLRYVEGQYRAHVLNKPVRTDNRKESKVTPKPKPNKPQADNNKIDKQVTDRINSIQ